MSENFRARLADSGTGRGHATAVLVTRSRRLDRYGALASASEPHARIFHQRIPDRNHQQCQQQTERLATNDGNGNG